MKDITENLLFWEQKIKERIESGMTIEQWCDKNKLSKHKYNYWNHRIKENEQQDKETTFAEVTPIFSSTGSNIQRADKSSDLQLFFKDMQVTIPESIDTSGMIF